MRDVTSRISREELGVGSGYVAPGTELERALAGLWGEKLGVEPVGIEDDFFELGGDSLLAADLLMDLQHRFGGEVDAAVLFLSPTIAALIEAMAPQERPSESVAG